jgi:predicted nucleic acid-binding protein
MGLYYFDSSALVKLYVLEPGSTWLRLLAAREPIQSIIIADMGVTEVAAALSILHRMGRIKRTAWDRAFDQFMNDVERRFDLAHTGFKDFFDAAELTRQYPLKAYDALQLTVALRRYRQLLAFGASLTFVAGDGTLLNAALAEGLAVDDPFDHVLLQDTPSRLP